MRAVHADIRQAPEIHYRFLEDPQDAQDLVGGIKAIRRILAQPAMAPYFESELTPGSERTDDAALLEFVRSSGGAVYHHAGTCRMGGDALAVVDATLKVRGVARLAQLIGEQQARGGIVVLTTHQDAPLPGKVQRLDLGGHSMVLEGGGEGSAEVGAEVGAERSAESGGESGA